MRKLLACIAFLAGATPSIAQQAIPVQATSQQIVKFVSDFQSGVLKGCLGNPPKGVSRTSDYCSCYAKSFVYRYSPDDLAAINNQVVSNPNIAYAINLMMKPEARACAAMQIPKVR